MKERKIMKGIENERTKNIKRNKESKREKIIKQEELNQNASHHQENKDDARSNISSFYHPNQPKKHPLPINSPASALFRAVRPPDTAPIQRKLKRVGGILHCMHPGGRSE